MKLKIACPMVWIVRGLAMIWSVKAQEVIVLIKAWRESRLDGLNHLWQ